MAAAAVTASAAFAQGVVVPLPATVTPPEPKAPIAALVSYQDYPSSALRSGEQGIVKFRLTVGPNGRVTGCAITASSGSSALDSTSCRILKSRARFRPARDSAGMPVAADVDSQLVWSLAPGARERDPDEDDSRAPD